MNYFERNDIYLFDHLHAACVKLSGIKEEHAHRISKIRSKNSISPESSPPRPKQNGKTTGNEIASHYAMDVPKYDHLHIKETSISSKRKDIKDYTITWLLCAFSLVVHHDLLQNTHIVDVKSTPHHVSGLIFIFSCPQNHSVHHLNFHCIKQIDYIFPCVCTLIDNRKCHRLEKTTITPLDFVSYYLFF